MCNDYRWHPYLLQIIVLALFNMGLTCNLPMGHSISNQQNIWTSFKVGNNVNLLKKVSHIKFVPFHCSPLCYDHRKFLLKDFICLHFFNLILLISIDIFWDIWKSINFSLKWCIIYSTFSKEKVIPQKRSFYCYKINIH